MTLKKVPEVPEVTNVPEVTDAPEVTDTFDKILDNSDETGVSVTSNDSDNSTLSKVSSESESGEISINDLSNKNIFIEKINKLNQKINNLQDTRDKINNEFINRLNKLNEQLTKLSFKNLFNKSTKPSN